MNDPFAPVTWNSKHVNFDRGSQWTPLSPVPADAAPPPVEHPSRGKPTVVWQYSDAAGRALHYAARFDEADGGKVVLPLTYCRNAAGGRPGWRWQAPDAPRPLYQLDALAARPDAPVIVTEGEKAADAAQRLLPDYVATTSSGGCKAAAKADWSPLKGRKVVIWPDADNEGIEYARLVARHVCAAGAQSVAIVGVVDGVAKGWDLADAEAEGWDTARVTVASESATVFDPEPPKRKERGRKRTAQADLILAVLDYDELWKDKDGEPHITVCTKGRFENLRIRSRACSTWIAGEYYGKTRGTIGSQALDVVLRTLEARAVTDGKTYETWRRVGRGPDGKIYLDLCDEARRVVEISTTGWKVVDRAPVKMLRSPAMRPLPEPEGGEVIERLRGFVHVANDNDFVLIVSWLVAALRPDLPIPILVINGEQGSGKSNLTKLLRWLIDPSEGPTRAAPSNDRDLMVSASKNWVLAFDNLSGLPNWLSDALCRVATGSGYATKKLYTDDEEQVFEATRPIILNGIPDLATRPDLADRAITISLPRISDNERRSEQEFWQEFLEVRPQILGTLLDAVSTALRDLPQVHLDTYPRMSDFAKWAAAAESAFGFAPGTVAAAYEANRKDVATTAFEADPLAVEIRRMIDTRYPNGWEGTATELLEELNKVADEITRRSRLWPQTASALGSKMRRIAPSLCAQGYKVEYGHSGDRSIYIRPKRPPK